MAVTITINTQLLSNHFDKVKLGKIPHVSDIGEFKNVDKSQLDYRSRAAFRPSKKVYSFSDSPLLMHLEEIDKWYDRLKEANVQGITIFLRYLSDQYFGTEFTLKEIELLHKFKAVLAIDFAIVDSPEKMR